MWQYNTTIKLSMNKSSAGYCHQQEVFCCRVRSFAFLVFSRCVFFITMLKRGNSRTVEARKKGEDKRRRGNRESLKKTVGRDRRGVVTVIESEQTPGTATEANPSIQESEPTHISPSQQ